MRLSHPTQLAPTTPVSEEITINATIRCLIRELDCLPNSAGLDELFRVVKGHAIRLDDVREFVRFFETRTDRYPAGSVLGGEDAAMHTVDNLSSARRGPGDDARVSTGADSNGTFRRGRRTACRSRGGGLATLFVMATERSLALQSRAGPTTLCSK
jgi:hypothetical protein